jgi:hypothetical protein
MSRGHSDICLFVASQPSEGERGRVSTFVIGCACGLQNQVAFVKIVCKGAGGERGREGREGVEECLISHNILAFSTNHF